MRSLVLFGLLLSSSSCVPTRSDLQIHDQLDERDHRALTWLDDRPVKDCTKNGAALRNCFEDRDTAMNPFVALHREGDTVQKTRYALVLAHGLSDSPYFFKDVALLAYDAKINVLSPLLEGHGTHPRDLTDPLIEDKEYWKKWAERMRLAVEYASQFGDRVLIGGLSLGGALAIYHAQEHPNSVSGLVLFSPAIRPSIEDANLIVPATAAGVADRMRAAPKSESTHGPDYTYVRYDHLPGVSVKQLLYLQRAIDVEAERDLAIFTAVSQYDDSINRDTLFSYLEKNAGSNHTTFFVRPDTFGKRVDGGDNTALYSKDREKVLLVETPADLAHASVLLSDSEPPPFTAETNPQFRHMSRHLWRFFRDLPR